MLNENQDDRREWKFVFTETASDDAFYKRGWNIGKVYRGEKRKEMLFREGLREYTIMTGKVYCRCMTAKEAEIMLDLHLKYGAAEEARIQSGLQPTFSDIERNLYFNLGRAMDKH